MKVLGNTQLPAVSSEDDELAEKEQMNGGNDMQGKCSFEMCQTNVVSFLCIYLFIPSHV